MTRKRDLETERLMKERQDLENEILRLHKQGLSRMEIAKQMRISPTAVTYRLKKRGKLNPERVARAQKAIQTRLAKGPLKCPRGL